MYIYTHRWRGIKAARARRDKQAMRNWRAAATAALFLPRSLSLSLSLSLLRVVHGPMHIGFKL